MDKQEINERLSGPIASIRNSPLGDRLAAG